MNAASQATALLDKAVQLLPKVPAVMTPELANTRLRTVEDVAAFFKTFEDEGQEPPFRFVYCARIDTGLAFRPYDVVVVPRGEQPAEHFVVSPTAVVAVKPSELSEVVFVQDWLRQARQFDAISRIGFFRNYLLLKHLRKWRRNVSVQNFHLARTRLAKRFFLAKNTFAKPTAEVRQLAFALRLAQPNTTMGRVPNVQAPPLPPGVSAEDARMQQALLQSTVFPLRLVHYPVERPQWGFTKDAFLDAQRQHFNKVAALFHRILEAITKTISNVAERVAAQAVVPDMTSFDELDQYLSQGSSVGGAVGTVANRQREQERQVRKRDLKRRIVEYDMLQPWVRLVDAIVTEELFGNATSTFAHLAKHLDLPAQGLNRELKVAFEVAPVFKDDDPIQFVPNEADFKNFMAGFVKETVDKLSRITRLIDAKDLRQHFFLQPDARSLSDMLDVHVPFAETLSRLDAVATRDYGDAADKSRIFEPCRAVLHFLTREWPDVHVQWQQRVQEKVGSDAILTEADLRRYITKVKRSQQDLHKLASRHVGSLTLYIAPLTADFQAKLDGVLADIRNSLLLLAQRRVAELAKDLESNIALLKHPGEDLRNFAEWLERVNQVEVASKQLLQDCTEVDTLYVIAEENHFEFNQLHRDKRDRTVGHGKGGELPLRLQLTDAIDNAKSHRESRLEAMRDGLNNAVADTIGVLDSLTKELREGEYREATHSASLIMTKLAGVSNTLHSIKVKQQTLNHYAELLGVEANAWTAMETATKEYEAKHELWSTVAQWDEKRKYWNHTMVKEIDGSKMADEMGELFQKARALNKTHDDSVSNRLLNSVTSEKVNLNVMTELCNPALNEEHWLKIFTGMKQRLPPAEARTLETMRSFGAYEQMELITTISSVATGEYNLKNQITKIANVWETMPFVLAKNKGANGKPDQPILGGLDEVMLQLEDNQVQVQTCLASRYVGGIKPLVEEWDLKLKTIFDVLNEWLNVQKSWLYLEFIFSSDDIKKQLPEESKLFSQVDKTFRGLMNAAVETNVVGTVCCEEGLLDSLQKATTDLDRVQKGLEDYLETKRVAFPRFYFLSNDELLSILSDVRNPMAVQPHLQKCFDNIKELDFESASLILAMKSQEGEVVPFSERIRIVGNVEHWLNDIEAMMRRTLYDITKAAFIAYPDAKRTEWYFQYPAQVVGCVDQIIWTNEIEDVWRRMGEGESDALVKYLEFYKAQILDTVGLVKGQLTSQQRTCCCTLIVVDVHARDVVANLIDEKTDSAVDFNWLKQLRYYWEADDAGRFDCHIRHSASHVLYGYEYLGNQLRLVITPLTERAFLTCTGALHMHQGAAPQGPAGTGKTESVKDLGKALARQVVVFNCSDGINYKTMSRMFAGLAQAGAWACFDEFNRIELEVLSVIAQQMLEIVSALGQKLDQMEFDGHPIKLSKNFGVFITMNPGYAGRTELPDNLKALFRPICMMIPDYALIAEIMFYSEGFADARTLAQKMVQLYKLSSEQLSKQDHYDFGMRAVKSILVMAGALKRNNPDESEDILLIRAMRDANVPKFLRDDTVLFIALIKDLFPSAIITDDPNAMLVDYLRKDIDANNLQATEGFLLKTHQLFDTMVVRHGVMTVGQTFCAKTTILNVLKRALTVMKHDDCDPNGNTPLINVVHTHVLNPKSITMGELYGDINPMTREWTDGLLSGIARNVKSESNVKPDRQWIVFDGPVDAIWIENMNTVLDDNKMLCLFNGERIKLPATASFVFEVQDLKVASPATVSRCGMVYVEPFYLDGGWSPVAKSTVTTLAKTLEGKPFRAERVLELLDALVPKTLEFIRRRCKEYIPSVDAQLVVSLLELLHGYVAQVEEDEEADTTDPAAEVDPLLEEFRRPQVTAKSVPPDARKLFDMQFVMSFIWSFGANLADASRPAFNEFAMPLLSEIFPFMPADASKSVFDICIHKPSLSFLNWDYFVPDFNYDRKLPYFDLIVPTVETTSMKSIMSLLAGVSRHTLVNGVTGTGKTVVIADLIATTLKADSPSAKWEYFATAFSAQTRSIDLQERIESKMTKVKSNLLGASPGKRAMFFIDDLNMPALEKYGASPPIELLRQIITQGGCYERKKIPSYFKEIQDLVVFAACGIPGGGRNEVTARLTSQFHLLCEPVVTTTSMRRIFSLILGGFLSIWPTEVRQLTSKIVEAARQCYERISKEKLPTPSKSHYTFNLRDFGKVFQGMLQADVNATPDRDSVVRLFVHEVSRVFHDRLTDVEDKQWWWKLLSEVSEAEFGLPWQPQYESLLFGDYMRREGRVYEEVPELTTFQDKLAEFQMNYNVDNQKEAELVFFADAAHHISRICRICRQPRGNALLVGVGGSGRQSLTRLAAYMCGMPVFQIAIKRGYGVTDFRDNVKEALLESGCKNKPVVFLLADNQIVHEQFLEDINNILNTGEVPNMMQSEDYDQIIESVRPFVKAAEKPETRGVMISHFVQLCRDNFHVVLTMSPIGEQFRRRLRMFPSLVSCTTIDWFIKWPADALEGVAMRYLSKMSIVDELKPALAKMCVKIHQDVEENAGRFFEELRRHTYTTPTSYLELLKAYDKMYDEQVTTVSSQINRLQGGLDKLAQTQVLVDEMKETLKRMQPELEQAAVDTERIMKEVADEQKKAEVVQAECTVESDAATVIREEADTVRNECQEQLDLAMPAYYGALEALKTLDSKDISEMKGMAQPPERVRIVVEAVLVLLGHKDLGWNNCKVVMSKSDFLSGLRTYDKDNVPDKIIRTLQKNYLNTTDKDKEFVPENIAKASVAAKSLCLWVRAIDNYTAVAKTIAPKKEQLADAEGKLKAAEDSLHKAQARLKEVQDKVAALQKDMQANIDRKKELEDQMKLTELRLGRAETLMSGLASEQVRWEESVARLNKQKKEVVGTTMVAAGCIAYLGPFTAPYRRTMATAWTETCHGLSIPAGATASLADITDPVKVREWGSKGLPQDDFSVENGVIVSRSQRWCLCIDPQGQANAWIRAMERDNNLRIIKLSEPNFMKTLTQAVNVGLPVLLENVEESIDAVIDPILLRETFKASGRMMLKLGDEEVEYDPNFRFYITTKLPNPHYMPELQIKVTIVNFTVTQAGLEEQLLADVVRYERNDLEQKADRTVKEIAEGKGQLKEIEERILSLLASSTGNILDNEALINALADAKKTSTSVTQNLDIAEKTQTDITATRNEYRPVATRGSLIYTVIANIAGIEHMYQYSLDFFKRLFLQTLKRTARSDDVQVRVQTLVPAVTLDSYNTVCRGLFERDKQLFAFLIAAEIFRASGDIKDAEWQFFLRGSEGQRLAEPDSWPAWSNEYVWNEVLSLSFVPGFEEVKNVVWSDESEWSTWAASDKAFESVPSAFEHLNPWQQSLIVKAFREDLLQYSLTRVVGHYLGQQFTESPAFNLEASFEDSSTVAPIIFVLTTGSDPTATFTEFADKKGFGDKKLMLSLGQDQGKKAEEMIKTACQSGQWVYLQNCHVYASWMPSLERKLEEIMLKDVHKDFRLWLTTMPTPSFPVLVLQSGIKVTKEPPRGLKANLKDSFLQEVTPELWASCQNATPWKRLLFSMSFFHAVIQERRKFGPLGWNIAYEWNQSDYSASIKSLFTYLSDYDTVQWKALKYMIGVINYGGRVTDFLDSRSLQTVLEKFFHPDALEGKYDITADGVYHIPAEVNDLDGVKKFLDNLPPYETPELFGLHANADITFNRNSSRRQLESILSVQPRTAAGAGLTPDQKVFQMADDMAKRLPAAIDKEAAHEDTYRITDDGTMVSLGTVVGQEIDVFNAIRKKLANSLSLLKRAIHGEVVMDAVLEAMYNAFLVFKVPESWHAGSYLSRKPLASWFEDTVQRIDFLRDWNDNGPPMSFWLPGFFFPQGFLTGVLQTHSRSCNMPIDDIDFRTHIMHMETADQVDDPPETGVYIHGLFMEGARFNRDTNAVDESLKGELFTSIPVVWLEPVSRAEVAVKSERTYVCPLYKTIARAGALSTTGLSTNFVRSLDLNAGSKTPSHWVQRGVALLCMLDD